MGVMLYHTLAFVSLFSYAIYHLVSATRSYFLHLRSATAASSSSSRGGAAAAAAGDYYPRPYHPLPLPLPHHRLRHLPLYLALVALLLSAAAHAAILPASTSPSATAVHRFASLEASAALLLLALLAAAILFIPLPAEAAFLLASLAFALLSSSSAHAAAASSPSDLQSKCDALAARASVASAAAALALALLPSRGGGSALLAAELALAASVALRGLWSLQTGFSLYLDAFIPQGCHRLLDLPEGAATRCDVDESRFRAAALLDLAFVLHAAFVSIIALTIYAAVARASGVSGGLIRRHNGGAYEALPTSSSGGALSDLDHIQMKALTKSSSTQA